MRILAGGTRTSSSLLSCSLDPLEPAANNGGIAAQEFGNGHRAFADGLETFERRAAVSAIHLLGISFGIRKNSSAVFTVSGSFSRRDLRCL